jgi:hypothetical protein
VQNYIRLFFFQQIYLKTHIIHDRIAMLSINVDTHLYYNQLQDVQVATLN